MVECIGGYFQFSVKADGLYFTVYPPKSGEQPATVADALYYLDKKKIMDCDTVKMKEAFSKAKEGNTLVFNYMTKAPCVRSDRGVIEENVLYHCL